MSYGGFGWVTNTCLFPSAVSCALLAAVYASIAFWSSIVVHEYVEPETV